MNGEEEKCFWKLKENIFQMLQTVKRYTIGLGQSRKFKVKV